MRTLLLLQENNNIAPRRVYLNEDNRENLLEAFDKISKGPTTIWAHLIDTDTGEIIKSRLR